MKSIRLPKTILLVDDDDSILSSFKQILEREGYSVETARTGKQALDNARSKYYNLVILDVKLPDIKGTRLLTEIGKISPKSRKIIITGYPSLDNAKDSVNYQADAYLVKPVKPTDFLKTIAENLKQQNQLEMTTEDNVMKWVESRHAETKREDNLSRGLQHKKKDQS